jgi:hypothetical protein
VSRNYNSTTITPKSASGLALKYSDAASANKNNFTSRDMTAGTSVKMSLRHRGGETNKYVIKNYGKGAFQNRRVSEAPPIVPMPREMSGKKRILA